MSAPVEPCFLTAAEASAAIGAGRLTSEALVTWAIMNPECSPLASARKGVRPVESAGLTSCSMRRSLMLASSAVAMAARSRAMASGWPWKLPPLMMSISSVTVVASSACLPSRRNTLGLSVTLLTSISSTERA